MLPRVRIPDKLQKEAYTAAGLPGNAPNTKMEKVRRTTLPTNHQAVMDLKPGEVSAGDLRSQQRPLHLQDGKQRNLTCGRGKTEIRTAISSQRYRDTMQDFQGNVDLNDAYFGPDPKSRHADASPGAEPPAQQAEDPD